MFEFGLGLPIELVGPRITFGDRVSATPLDLENVLCNINLIVQPNHRMHLTSTLR